MSKKVLITGHTSGIGRAIFDKLEYNSFKVKGVSRSNDFDISSPEIRFDIAKLSLDYDVFINNANDEFSQVELLMTVHDHWRQNKKVAEIINLGSRAAESYAFSAKPKMYEYQKLALRELSVQLSHKSPCKISCVNLGYVGTEKILDRPELARVPKLDLDSVANMVLWIVNQPENISLSEISAHARL